MSEGYPGRPAGPVNALLPGVAWLNPWLELRSLTVQEPSSPRPVPTRNGKPIEDRAFTGPVRRVVVAIWCLATLVWLVAAIVTHREAATVVSASLVFVGAVIILIRSRRPIETWPLWLFTWRR
jgi:hypothetical protein